ncbi:7-cyano-7-deazaguanine synthase QueC [Candidatus Peregrinibacteria bacterium]|nr:7-cyano-7-deazaguanine synthase QueC [Candidatus Peregrinibacteria bacterium]
MKKALVVFSGGQDSSTCLVWAMRKFDAVEAITFDYDQRHRVEIVCAKKIAKIKKIKHTVIDARFLHDMTKNALTRKNVKIEWKNALPSTFVPGRNLMFLSLAGIIAYQKGIQNIVAGVCQTDFSGYPDCRDAFIQSLQKTLNLAMEYDFTMHTPLMFLTKKETVELMRDFGEIDLLRHTHTCYYGKRPACGACPACELRLKGFREAGIADPLPYEKV